MISSQRVINELLDFLKNNFSKITAEIYILPSVNCEQ